MPDSWRAKFCPVRPDRRIPSYDAAYLCDVMCARVRIVLGRRKTRLKRSLPDTLLPEKMAGSITVARGQFHGRTSKERRLRPMSRSPDSFHRITSLLVNEIMTPWLVSTRIFLKKRLISKPAAFL